MRGEKQENILRVLLNEPEISKKKLSELAECSRPWVIEYLKKLEKQGLLKGTKILNKKKLIEYWLSIHTKPNKYREYMIREPLTLLQKTNLDYALTTYQAENIVQHYLFPMRTDIYIKEEDLDEWHKLMAKNGLYGKGNVRVMIENNHVMYKKRKLNKLWVVSTPQLIIDLFTEGSIAKEAADMLLKKI